MILIVQIQNFGARRRLHIKVLIIKNSRDLNIDIFCVKIVMKLPFTLKNKRKQFYIWFLKTIFYQRKSAFLVFEENLPHKFVSSCFGSDSNVWQFWFFSDAHCPPMYYNNDAIPSMMPTYDNIDASMMPIAHLWQ